MQQIKFKQLVVSPTYGNCGAGAVLRCSDAFAEHCVKTLKAADYLQAGKPEKPKRKRATRKKVIKK